MQNLHSESLPQQILVVTNLSQEELKVASFPCASCCKNFSSDKVKFKKF